MSKRDTLKTARISILAEEQASDGYQDRHVRKARRKERQKAKNIIKQELKDYIVIAKPRKPCFSKAMIKRMMKDGKS